MATKTGTSKTAAKAPANARRSTTGSRAPAQASTRKAEAAANAQEIAKADVVTATRPPFKRVAKPDSIDFRDRPFNPNISITPALKLFPKRALKVKHQGETNACTGFGLSLVVEHLLRHSTRTKIEPVVSPYMLYSMARRYDEFPGSVSDDGSSLRGALKGWFKHGVCSDSLFPSLEMPQASNIQKEDWWLDAVRRPLGAYYRIDPRSITDMHAALNEVGILYVSAGCHSGWDDGGRVAPLKRRPSSFTDMWVIPVKGGNAQHPGHAFAIVGYNETGFLIQNSWGTDWGSYGYAILSYDDWVRNAMDCWVAQLGVVTREHQAIAGSISLRAGADGKVALAASEVLRNREIAPFIVNMGNNGALSNSGTFRTTPDDVRAIVDVHLAAARKLWGMQDKPIDVCIYAHGGLVGEAGAAEIAASWIPMLYERRIFPIFLMWETDFITTVMNTIEDRIKGLPRTAGFSAVIEKWWNQRLERLLARPGTQIWGEMKQNADAMSLFDEGVADDRQAGAVLLYRHFKQQVEAGKVRMHMVGHSAGSIVASYMIDRLVQDGMALESLSFLAPAVTLQTFGERLLLHLKSGAVKRYQQFHLSGRAEEDDPSCGPYRRSLLYLVSESFEGGTTTPILGMQKYFDPYAKHLPPVTTHVSPAAADPEHPDVPPVASSTHGGFDNDPGTQAQVLRFILGAGG